MAAALSAEPGDDVGEKLGKCEQLLFGAKHPESSDEGRLWAIERHIFGKKKKGDFDRRLTAALSVLLIKHPERPEWQGHDTAAVQTPAQQSKSNDERLRDSSLSPGDQALPSPSASAVNRGEHLSSGSSHQASQTAGEGATQDFDSGHGKQAVDNADRPADVSEDSPSKRRHIPPPSPTLKSQSPKLDSLNTRKEPLAESSGIATKERERQLLRQGMAAYARNDTSTAEQIFKEVILINSRSADAFYNLGAIAEGKGDYISALTNYRSALQVNPADQDIQKAVSAVEQLIAEQGRNRQQNNRIARTGNHSDAYPPVAPPIVKRGVVPMGTAHPFSEQQKPEADDYAYPVLNAASQNAGASPVGDGSASRPFELSSTQNTALQNAQSNVSNGSAQQNVQRPRSPVVNVAARTALGVLISVGSSYALRGTGLHCPACRIFSNGQLLRTGLRGLFR